MKCDIVIPVWNQLETTKECIDRLFKNTRYPYRLILVDNGSEDSTKGYLENIEKESKSEVTLVRNKENLGFVKAVNQGLKLSEAPYVCILNNDTLPTSGWLSELINFAEKHPDIGLLNPISTGHKSKNLTIDEHAKKISSNKDKYMEMNQCFGFCLLIKRGVIDKIGYLDEGFGVGGFDDTDYSMRAGLANFRCACVHSSYVYHKEHVSFNAMGERKKIVSKGEKEYFKKWPKHRRLGVSFSLKDKKNDEEIKNFLESSLFLAREWCWLNLWISGKPNKDKEDIKRVSKDVNMPLHQNLKFSFISSRFKAINVLIRLMERAYGRKKRKKYDVVLVNEEKLSRFLNMFYPLHKTRIHFADYSNKNTKDLEKVLTSLRSENDRQ